MACPSAEAGSGPSGLQGLRDAAGYRGTIRNTDVGLALGLCALTAELIILPASAMVP